MEPHRARIGYRHAQSPDDLMLIWFVLTVDVDMLILTLLTVGTFVEMLSANFLRALRAR